MSPLEPRDESPPQRAWTRPAEEADSTTSLDFLMDVPQRRKTSAAGTDAGTPPKRPPLRKPRGASRLENAAAHERLMRAPLPRTAGRAPGPPSLSSLARPIALPRKTDAPSGKDTPAEPFLPRLRAVEQGQRVEEPKGVFVRPQRLDHLHEPAEAKIHYADLRLSLSGAPLSPKRLIDREEPPEKPLLGPAPRRNIEAPGEPRSPFDPYATSDHSIPEFRFGSLAVGTATPPPEPAPPQPPPPPVTLFADKADQGVQAVHADDEETRVSSSWDVPFALESQAASRESSAWSSEDWGVAEAWSSIQSGSLKNCAASASSVLKDAAGAVGRSRRLLGRALAVAALAAVGYFALTAGAPGSLYRTLGRIADNIEPSAAFEVYDGFEADISEGWRGEGLEAAGPGLARISGFGIHEETNRFDNYRFEFEARIIRRAVSWVLRARDRKNYYAFRLIEQGPEKRRLERYAVIDGKAEEPFVVDVELPALRESGFRRISARLSGSSISTFVDGLRIDYLKDARLPSGGAGFLARKGDEAELRYFTVYGNQDWAGVLLYGTVQTLRKAQQWFPPGEPAEEAAASAGAAPAEVVAGAGGI